jgi:hypothetical protein
MAKYFIDFEFIEGFKKPLFGKRRHFIDMISVGICCDDGREYYAISKEYRYNDASDWVKENVILPMYKQLSPAHKQFSEPDNFHKYEGKSNEQIVKEIAEFCKPTRVYSHEEITLLWSELKNPEFYGYYSDYDWVLFCSLFGTMMDLPTGFPMYCIDLNQTLDEKESILKQEAASGCIRSNDDFMNVYLAILDDDTKHVIGHTADIKNHRKYPKQSNEHNALDDAKWNKALYEFIKTI